MASLSVTDVWPCLKSFVRNEKKFCDLAETPKQKELASILNSFMS